MNLQESIRRILREETKDMSKKLEKVLNKVITEELPEYVCRIMVSQAPSDWEGRNDYSATVYFLEDAEFDMRNGLMSKVWNIIYNLTNKTTETYSVTVNSCEDFVDNGLDFKLNETRTLQEDDKNLPTVYVRRIDHHKFEKLMRTVIIYADAISNSFVEFKYRLIELTLETYFDLKYGIDIDTIPTEDTKTFINYMLEIYDPLLKSYYRNLNNKK